MKVLFDTNLYIKWIRERKYSELFLNHNTQKYLSCIVVMELWAGAKTKNSIRIVQRLQQPYFKTNRIITLNNNNYITAGQILSKLPVQYKSKKETSSFLNDILISLSAVSVGGILYTNNQDDFELIMSYIQNLKVRFFT